MKHFSSIIVFAIMVSFFNLHAQELNITIENIRNQSGVIRLALFTDEKGFRNEKPSWAMAYPKGKNNVPAMHIRIGVKEGTYALSVLDDENNNGKMDYRLLCIPREGFGFSNYIQQGIKKPRFKDFSFLVQKNQTKTIAVKMRYF